VPSTPLRQDLVSEFSNDPPGRWGVEGRRKLSGDESTSLDGNQTGFPDELFVKTQRDVLFHFIPSGAKLFQTKTLSKIDLCKAYYKTPG
jgi:hypothetical protein